MSGKTGDASGKAEEASDKTGDASGKAEQANGMAGKSIGDTGEASGRAEVAGNKNEKASCLMEKASRPEVLAPMKAALERWMDQKTESSIAEIFPAGEP